MVAVNRSVPVLLRRMTAPRQNSCRIVPKTKPENTNAVYDAHTRTPSANTIAAVTSPAVTGHINWNLRFEIDVFRHASSGPTPVSSNKIKPIGTIQRLKNGGPVVMGSPVNASLSVGNMVANRTKKAQNNRIQLLTRNAASRDAHESSSLLARSRGSR